MPLPYGLRFRDMTTFWSSASCDECGVARLSVLRFTHVWTPRNTAALSHDWASEMSAFVQGTVAGPTLNMFTPAPTTASRPSAPAGVVPSRGGGFDRTIGKNGRPARRKVPFVSKPVVLPPSPPDAP